MGWQQSYSSPWVRQQEISLAVTQLLKGVRLDQSADSQAGYYHQQQATWLVNRLIKLGPTFIKLGQFLTSRIDLLPLEYIQALKTLPGWMPPINIDTVFSSIEAELGASAFLLYRTFDSQPIASDSFGQVHRATLPNGATVAVKIQRPGLGQLVKLDLAILRKLLSSVQRHFGHHAPCDLNILFEEFAQQITQELNWIQTAINADRLLHNFRDTPVVWVPQIYPSYTTQRILTLEYAPGITLTDRLRLEAGGFEPKTIQQLSVYCYLKQVLQDGFFQTNLNPSKSAISQDNRLVLYGFSEVTALSPLKRSQLIQALLDLRQQDSSAAVRSLVNGGLLQPDIAPVLMGQMMQVILQYLHQDDLKQPFNQVQADVYQLFQQQPFCLPSQTLWLLQGLTGLNEIAQSLDPTYNWLKASQPLLTSPSIYQRFTQQLDSLGTLLTGKRWSQLF